MNPNDPVILNGLGGYYSDVHQNKVAISYFEKAIELSPDYSDSYYNNGCCYFELGQDKKAKQSFLKAKELGHEEAQKELDNLK